MVIAEESISEQQDALIPSRWGVWSTVERWLYARMVRLHGRGHSGQHDYYRCRGCHGIVTWRAIRAGGCACGLSREVAPAVLTWWERFRLVWLPWWGVVR